jgi:hypothetical protein
MLVDVINQIQDTLTQQSVPYQEIIDSFGQVAALERRSAGRRFSLRDHVRALLLSQLSNNRPWGTIARNLSPIRDIFLNYDPVALKEIDPASLTDSIIEIGCGNRSIAKQLNGLRQNIETFERIDNIDKYVVSADPEVIAKSFAKGKYKLVQIGFTLAMEYLRNVGIDAIKPDLHICRMIGPERLGLTEKVPTPEQAYAALMGWARTTEHSALFIDNLLWIFAAQDYGKICTANPKCHLCLVKSCNMKKRAH